MAIDRLRANLAGRLLALFAVLMLAACTNALESRLPDSSAIDLSPKGKTAIKSRQGNPQGKAGQQGSYELFAGTAVDGGSVGDLSSGAEGVEQTGDKFSINVDGADIAEVTKLVLGDTLGFNYIIDQRVQGTMTISTIRPMTSNQVLSAFEQALRLNGATLIHQGETYKVVPLQEVLEGEMGTAQRAERGAAATPGYGVTFVPLRFIAPNNMLELLDSFIARSGSVRASNIGTMVLVRGSGQERKQLVDVILSFDVDWMKQQSASIAILANSKPAEMVQKLQAIFATDTSFSGANALKVIPLERLNGVVIIANSQQKVRRALSWVGRLDQESDEETQYYVYNVQNGSAVGLAKILNATFLEKSGEETVASQVDPNQDTATVTTDSSSDDEDEEDVDEEEDDGSDQSAGGKADRLDGAVDTAATGSTTEPKTDLSSGIRITPNPETNTIVIRAPPKVFAKILSTLKQIDKQAVQVLVNAMIAEVSLNDTLAYGVQAYLKEKDINVGYSEATGLAIKPNIAGFNFLFGGAVDPTIVLEALSEVTRVKVVSSPSVVVLENENAVIKVGDSVPIKVREQQSTSGDSNIVNQIEYRDSGVILKVKPRVSANGTVTMLVSQELSSVTGGTADNPTFSQRTVSSTVSVPSSQTVALGGLISGQETRGKKSVPLLNKVPVIGDLVGKTENIARRTELIVFITPQVIQDGEDASRVSEELRERMRNLGFN
jgi:general secretion pathway protein D